MDPTQSAPGGSTTNCASPLAEPTHGKQSVRQEDKANRIFEAAATAMLVVRETGDIESANTAAMRLFGYNWDQLVGMNVDRLLPAHLHQAHTMHRQQYARDPRARSMGIGKTLAAIKADGSGFPVEVGLTPLKDDDGLNIIVSIIDLSSQFKAHEEIKRLNHELSKRLDAQSQTQNQTEKDLRSVLDHMPSMIGYWDKSLRNRFGNRAYLDWFGISPQEMPGKHIRDVIGPERFELNKPFIEGALSGKAQFFERAIPSPDGTVIRHTQAQYLPDFGPNNEVIGFYVLVNDVTPIKQAQAKAQDILHFNQAIIEHAPIGVAVYHPEGQCLLANHALAKAYGKTETDLLQENFFDIPHWQASGLLDDATAVLKTGETRHRTCITQNAAGITLYLSCTLQPIIRNERLHLLLITTDITQQEQANKTISQALETARIAAEAKGQFLAAMSHEIRTPLNAVLSLAQLGEQQSRDHQSARSFAQINEAGQHLLALINDVLDFSRIEAGKLTLKETRIETASLLQHLCTVVAHRAQAKGLRFQIDESVDFPCAFQGDDTRLAQILINLLGNAVTFTQVGQVTLRMRVDEDALVFEVDDTGSGIQGEHRAKLFSPFEQLGDNPDAQNGSGLGLAISKKLSDLMGGQLSHQPKSGIGCCFQLRLPKRGLMDAEWHELPPLRIPEGDTQIQGLAHQLQRRGLVIQSIPTGSDPFQPTDVVLTSNQGPSQMGYPYTIACMARAQLTVLMQQDPEQRQSLIDGYSTVLPIAPYTTPLMFRAAVLHALSRTKPQGDQRRLHGIRILAAEDNPVNRLVLEQMILQEGASIDFGFDGQQALDLVQQHGPEHYDIVLCDIQMPVMDGFETTKALATLAPGLPVVGLTAHAFETARLQARDAGMIDYVTKPYLLDTLVKVILQHTRRTPASTTPPNDITQSHQDLTTDPAYPDWRAMQDHFGNNPALMSKLTQTLKEAGADILRNMSEAVEQIDYARLRQEAHSLKGAALNLHTPQLARQAAELQNLASLQAPLALTLARELMSHLKHFLDYLDQAH